MKKIFTTIVLASLTFGAMAQEAADKTVQAGLVLGGGMNFNKMGTNLASRDGVGGDFTVGMNLNWNFQPNIGLTTGIEFDIENFGYTSFTDSLFYNFSDKEILLNDSDISSADLFQVESRKYKAKYLTIPIMLKFQTNFIGYFRYFGKFGLRNSILLGSKIDDIGTKNTTEANVQNFNMVAKSDLYIFKSAVGGAVGAEWNFTGATSLVLELGYYYGFTPIHQSNNLGSEDPLVDNNGFEGANRHLFTNETGNRNYETLNATQGQLQIKASILF